MSPAIRRMTAAALTLACCAAPALADEPKAAPRPIIEIAVLLDTSGSMDGLINQARAKIWSIINQTAAAKKDGLAPDLRVALYEYGKQSVPASEGFVRQIVPLSDDLDKISAELFALTTNGGEEYCAVAIRKAVEQLSWTPGDNYQAIFIAGNEPFSQGPEAFEQACRLAISKGIVVNTIHCGSEQDGINGKWKDAARLADGQAINIDHNAKSVAIVAPQDGRLEELSRKLNETYLAFGDQGEKLKRRQQEQDKKAESAAGGAAPERARAKAGRGYRNDEWDLVDAVQAGKADVATVEEEALPDEMKGMDVEKRKAFVAEKSAERTAVQDEIKKLSAARQTFLVEEQKKQVGDGAETFDSAVREILKQQLAKKGYVVE